ncbi:uncharacterized protein JCM15063_002397 [Sporobolomyces koalae]|uniref:uncharacterized protein n=1 Tax=Sporobolomyces koalae TaxID=500713 RepID=UPI0031813CD9
MANPLPPTLPILPLPPNTVLYPNLLLSIQLQSRHAIALVRSVVDDAASGSSKLLIACVPLKPTDPIAQEANKLLTGPEPNGTRSEDAEQDSTATSDPSQLKSLRIETDQTTGMSVNSLSDGRPLPEELFDYGTAARIVRLERLAAGGFLAVLEGIARIAIDSTSYPSPPALSPFYSARISLLASATSLPGSHAPLVTRLRTVTLSILSILPGSPTPLPSLFDRKLRQLATRLSLASCLTFLDTLFYSLPLTTATNLSFLDKCRVLSLGDPVDRLEAGIEVLAKVLDSLETSTVGQDKVDESASKRQREYALMQQLLAIKQELDQLANSSGASSTRSVARRNGTEARRSIKASTDEGEEDEGDELAELEHKIHEKSFSDEARRVALREFKRLKKTPPQGAEYGVIRTYIETLLAIPWTTADATPLPLSRDFISDARKKLDEDHYGLTKIKKRLLEWLAVSRLQQDRLAHAQAPAASSLSNSTVAAVSETATSTAVVPYVPPAPSNSIEPSRERNLLKSPILLLHGPPGVGKTSIARSLADAMGRKFVRISLGGVRDEAEIRGHRRTYVGAMPGKLVAALRKAGTSNPVILLDEVDKMGHASHHGDPSAAMLEVLDPEQNWCFEDHYLGMPLDLSQVLFIATANSLETISEPLYDRMEPVELSGYIHDEKLFIARHKLLPKQLAANALDQTLVSIEDSTLLHLIQNYTREAGVRTLERVIGSVCRAKAVEYAEARDRARDSRSEHEQNDFQLAHLVQHGYQPRIETQDLELILGDTKHEQEELGLTGRIGVSTGLAYQGSGNGSILHIETSLMPGSGRFHLTGQLGDVISESARLAFAWVKSHAYELGISDQVREDVFKHVDVHLHLPSGSIKKDGPSAGVAIVVAIVSLMRGVAPKACTAMTGEITLRGDVTPVGGIKEKLLGAHRSGIRRVVLPFGNRKNVYGIDAGLPTRVKDDLEIVWVRTVSEALEATLPALDPDRMGRRSLEMSRL